MIRLRRNLLWLIAIVAAGTLFIFFACVWPGPTLGNYEKVKLGMTLPEVETILGVQHEPMTPWVTFYWVIWKKRDGNAEQEMAVVLDWPEIGHGKVVGKWMRRITDNPKAGHDIRLLHREGEGYFE